MEAEAEEPELSLSSEAQAQADAVDQLNFVRFLYAEVLSPQGLCLRGCDEHLAEMEPAMVITDCKSLYDAIERNESLGLGLAEKRTSIEVSATRQVMRETNVRQRWVNSDRQLADVLTKTRVNPDSIMKLLSRGRWKIVFDPDFTSAKNVRKTAREARDGHFRSLGNSRRSRRA